MMNFLSWNRTVESIYAAAATPTLWPETLQSIAELFDGQGALLLYRHDNGHFGTIVSPALVNMARDYERHWQHLDVRAERVFHAIATGHHDVQADHTFFTEEEVAILPIYQQFLLPHGIRWGMTVPVSPSPTVNVILTLLRAKEKPPYEDAFQEQLLALSRHVERSLSLSIRLIDAETERMGLSDALDRFDCGVFILGANRMVLLLNRTAQQILGSGLVLSIGALSAIDDEARTALHRQIDAVATGSVPTADTHKPLVVPDGNRALIVQVLPLLSPFGLPALRSATAVVLVEDPTSTRPFDPAVVRDAFKLTLGEARLAALVGAGISPVDAGATLGIKNSTVRTVLKRVFEKMGVSRQSELAALMGKLFLVRRS